MYLVIPNSYKYNGKQLQDENIGGNQLNLYGYGARNLYQYFNNPVLYNEMKGDSIDDSIDDSTALRKLKSGKNNSERFRK